MGGGVQTWEGGVQTVQHQRDVDAFHLEQIGDGALHHVVDRQAHHKDARHVLRYQMLAQAHVGGERRGGVLEVVLAGARGGDAAAVECGVRVERQGGAELHHNRLVGQPEVRIEARAQRPRDAVRRPLVVRSHNVVIGQ